MPLFPSISESFGIVLLEAWENGCACIACKNSAPGTVVEHGKNGLLFDYENSDELSKKISELVSDDTFRSRLAICGRKKVLDGYTWESVVQELELVVKL